MRTAGPVRRSLVAVTWLATLAGAFVLAAVGRAGPIGLNGAGFSVVFIGLAVDVAVFATVGAVLALRRPDNTVGAVLLGTGVLIVVAFLGFILGAILTAERGADDALAGWMSLTGALAIEPALIAAGPLLALLFPDGHLPGPRWRWPVGASAGLLAVGSVLVAAQPGILGDSLAENPIGIAGVSWLEGVGGFGIACTTIALLATLVTAVAAVIVRFRRASEVEGEQLKWFVAAYSVVVIGLVLSLADGATEPTPFDLLAVVSLSLPPLAVGIAILRYRLYDIDRIVSRTLSYAFVTAILGAVFVGVILLLQMVLAGVVGNGGIPVAVSTLAVFALFQPVLRRVRRAVDRRFDRARYDGERTAGAFAERLRWETDMDRVTGDLRATVEGAIAPVTLGIWLRQPGAR